MNIVTRIRPGVKAFIVHEGKILVIKERIRDNRKTSLIYDVPGGGVEAGESLRVALAREVMEEVGLAIDVQHPVGGWDFVFHKSGTHEHVHVICLGYQCKLVGKPTIDTTKNPAIQEEIFDAQWLTKEEILRSKKIMRNAD
ncbi:MAG TPA: NUDIX hydrolase, partial [Patescibacteria group bacterium]|nr:NUDIX hydrolase [Patescibacteria group bacterium]